MEKLEKNHNTKSQETTLQDKMKPAIDSAKHVAKPDTWKIIHQKRLPGPSNFQSTERPRTAIIDNDIGQNQNAFPGIDGKHQFWNEVKNEDILERKPKLTKKLVIYD